LPGNPKKEEAGRRDLQEEFSQAAYNQQVTKRSPAGLPKKDGACGWLYYK
jgi:hypothetical protein